MTNQDANPYDSPSDDDHSEAREDSQKSSGQHAYKIVSDTVTGPNVRWKDNIIQAVTIAVSLVIGAGVGAVAVQERVPGALVGGFIGLIVGLFGSGLFLMIYRAARHIRGRHD